MKIDISNILKFDGASLDLDFNELIEVNDFVPEDFSFNEPVSLKGTLVNVGKVIKLDGELKTGYRVKCSRCLKDIESKVCIVLKEDFVEESSDNAGDEYTYQGKALELEKMVIDNILLNLPVRQVCDETCKGFCPKCGEDLNSKECKCVNEDIDPRMEALKNFFKDD